MITLNLTEIENHAEVGTNIAKGFTKFCLDEKHNHPEKFVFRKVHYADEPKSLNYYLMDKDCVAILKRMYGGDNGYTNKNLWSMVISSPMFLDVRSKVRKCWRLWTITPEISPPAFLDARRKVMKECRCWRLWTITPGTCWIENILVANKREQMTRVKT